MGLAFDKWLEREPHLAHRAEDAVFRRVRLQAERAADLLDRLPLEVTEHERGALHVRQPLHRAADFFLDLGAQHETLRRWINPLFISTMHAVERFQIRR